jgi:hypothetical protein
MSKPAPTPVSLLGRLGRNPNDGAAWRGFVQYYGGTIFLWCRHFEQKYDAELRKWHRRGCGCGLVHGAGMPSGCWRWRAGPVPRQRHNSACVGAVYVARSRVQKLLQE